MAHSTDPFTPRLPLSLELLERYAQGRLSDEERHAVELHLEGDPLLREAMAGLELPGAVTAFNALRKPGSSSGWEWAVPLTAVVLLIGGVILYRSTHDPAPQRSEAVVEARQQKSTGTEAIPAVVESTLQVVHAEIDARAGMEARANNTGADRFQKTIPANQSLERKSIERMEAQPVALDRTSEPPAPHAAHNAKSSRQLVFLHDLKLVHPKELYGDGPPRLHSPGVPANVDPVQPELNIGAGSTQQYLDFMDVALQAISTGDNRRALDDLYFLLNQYPDDVNAQFYAGLACYRLGLYPRALRLLKAAAENGVDSFREEALWYEALATTKQEGKAAARPALERIASSGGFYAAQAKALLEAR